MQPDDSMLMCDRIARALAARGVRQNSWACARLEHDRYCIVWDADTWRIGYSERGSFDVSYETDDVELAIAHFVDWVTESDRKSRGDAEATKKWLARHGLKRP